MSSQQKKQTPTREDLIRRAEIEFSRDIHTLRAAHVYEVPPEKVTPKQRQGIKEATFGERYGFSVDSLRNRLKVSKEAVIRLTEKMHANIPALREFQKKR